MVQTYSSTRLCGVAWHGICHTASTLLIKLRYACRYRPLTYLVFKMIDELFLNWVVVRLSSQQDSPATTSRYGWHCIAIVAHPTLILGPHFDHRPTLSTPHTCRDLRRAASCGAVVKV